MNVNLNKRNLAAYTIGLLTLYAVGATIKQNHDRKAVQNEVMEQKIDSVMTKNKGTDLNDILGRVAVINKTSKE